MSYERCVGLEVSNEALYQQYRDAMTPMLVSYGGSFRYDFKVAEVLRSETPAPINRIFIIAFKDKTSHDAFFQNPDYLRVRQRFFNPSVRHVTQLAESGA